MAVANTIASAPGRTAPCLMVIFGAAGDLTKRLLMPALYNLACDGLLPEQFGIIGVSLENFTDEQFRTHLTEDIHRFNTRPLFDSPTWGRLAAHMHYVSGNFGDDATYTRLSQLIADLEPRYQTEGNVLFYLATPPVVFGLVASHLGKAGLSKRDKGWSRLVVEKPFGRDLESAKALNKTLLANWAEDQIYRMDHYLGKETVQNIIAFRFANGIYEAIWNRRYVDHIQMNVAEVIGVETRGAYYDKAGVLRDMMQNHMFQMLAYLTMEPPASLRADAVRNEKSKLLESIRVMSPEDVPANAVRGQYGPGKQPDGTPVRGYREEPGVNPQSNTETYAATRLFIDNWRWEGVPIYLRSGKSLWKRGTEIVIQFKKAPDILFHHTPSAGKLEGNRLIFHVQPDQGIEFRFHAKHPGPSLEVQNVTMRFDYREAFDAARGTGYEVLLHSCFQGDPTLFSRTDLVELAWRIVQPILDHWGSTPAAEFPNYTAGSWGPKAAFDLIERDGREWVEVINRSVLDKVPLFKGLDATFLHRLAITLTPAVRDAGQFIVRAGEAGDAMYFICSGEAEAIDENGRVLNRMGEGEFFGELALLLQKPRAASVRATSECDLFVLSKHDFDKVLKDYPPLAAALRENARHRYHRDAPESSG
jgi:glucose-6-phosphate 1-dehydrogenase